MHRNCRLTYLVLMLLLGFASTATAQQQPPPDLAPEAKARLDKGVEAYKAKDYATAIQEFKASYQIDPNPALLYAWAQAERLNQNCPRALELYGRYLGSEPNTQQVQAARSGIELCQQQARTNELDRKRDEGGADGTSKFELGPKRRTDLAIDRAPTVPGAERKPWYLDPVGDALTVAGGVSIGIGTGFLIMARASDSRAEDAEFLDDFEQHRDAARTRGRVGAVAVTAGSALVVGGVIRFALRGGSGEPGVTATVTGDGAAVVLGGSF